MATDPGWGVASGFLAGSQEQQALALGKQQLTLNQQAIEMGPVTLEKEKLAFEVSKQSFDAHNLLIRKLQAQEAKIPGGDPVDPVSDAANTLLQTGKTYIESGLPEEGTKLMSDGVSVLNRASEIAHRSFDIADKQAKFVEGLVGTVADAPAGEQAQAYSQALATARMSGFGDAVAKFPPQWDPVKGPMMVEEMRKAAAAHRTQAQEALTKAQEAEARVKTKAQEYENSPEVRAQKETLIQERINNYKKNGNLKALQPDPKIITELTQKLKSQFPEQFLSDTTGAGYADKAYDLEPEVRALMAKNPLMNQTAAVNQIITTAAKTGHLPWASRTIRPGEAASSPMPLPLTKDNKIDPSGLKDGKWYPITDPKTGQQVSAIWNARQGRMIVPDPDSVKDLQTQLGEKEEIDDNNDEDNE